MLILVLIGLAVWAVLAAIACLTVCMASARFHRASAQHASDYETCLTVETPRPAHHQSLAAQQSQL